MTESSSQNSSDPEKRSGNAGESSSSEGEGTPQPRLKLKQLLTPLSPHLKVENKKDEDDQEEAPYRPKMEIPRAVPLDPEPELQPHEKPPHADGIPSVSEDIPAVPSQQPPGVPDVPPAGSGDPDLQQDEAPEKDEPETLLKAPKSKKQGKFKKLALVLLMVLLMLAGLQYFLDPLGLTMESSGNPKPVVKPTSIQPVTTRPEAQTNELEPPTIDIENLTSDSFLQLLENQQIDVIEDPRGAIINSVFFAEGSTLNPQLNLVLESIDISGKSKSIVIVDGSGKQHQFKAN